MKKSLVGRIRGRIGVSERIEASERVKALLLLAFDFSARFGELAILFCYQIELAKELLQKFH